MMKPKREESDNEERRNKEGDDDSNAKQHWITLVQQWLQRKLSSGSTRVAATMSVTAVLILIIVWTRRRRRRQLDVGKLHTVTPPDIVSPTYALVSAPISVSLSTLLNAVEQGRLHKALLGRSRILFQTHEADITSGGESTKAWKQTILPSNNEILKKHIITTLTEKSKQHNSTELGILPEADYGAVATTLLAALPFLYLALVYRMMREQQNHSSIRGNSGSNRLQSTSNSSNKTFADVAGLDSAVTELSEIVDYLQNPQRYHAYGASAPRGVLLSGPPGTGKTLLARAVHGEVARRRQGQCVFVACSASEFVELYVGRGAARVRALFQSARDQARSRRRRQHSTLLQRITTIFGGSSHTVSIDNQKETSVPCAAIIFIDELDALAKTRSHGLGHSNDEREQTLNQLLIEMDGFSSNDDGVTLVVLAATNRADVLDPAIVRRFDRHVSVGYPNSVSARRAILRVHAQKITMAVSAIPGHQSATITEINEDDDCSIGDDDSTIDWTRLASDELTGNMSGSDLRNLINEAALLAVRDTNQTAPLLECHGVSQRHLEEAALKIRRTKTQGLMIKALTPPRGGGFRPTMWG